MKKTVGFGLGCLLGIMAFGSLLPPVVGQAEKRNPRSAGPDEKSKAVREGIQGKWKCVKAETGMGPLKDADKITFTFSDDRLVMTAVGGQELKAKFKLDATKSPTQLTFVIIDEVGEEVINNYICELKGDNLKIAGAFKSRPGLDNPFPKEFKINDRDVSFVGTFEKVKETK